MDASRKKQIIQEVENLCLNWKSGVKGNWSQKETAEYICKSISCGIILTAGRHFPAAYVGPNKQCLLLKKQFGGRIGNAGHGCFWLGYASGKDINRCCPAVSSNKVYQILAEDMAELLLEICMRKSADIKYSSHKPSPCFYIGSQRICVLLKRSFGGKIKHCHFAWYWTGTSNAEGISEIIKNYRETSKRYNKKRIVI